MSKMRTWTNSDLQNAVKESHSFRQVLQKIHLREAGGNYDQVKKYMRELGLDTTHFVTQAWNKGLKGLGKDRIALADILVKGSTFQSFKLKKRLFRDNIKKRECEECGWAKISLDGRLPLELDHINGDRHDNRLENLRVLCPNCHSLKPTHRGRNKHARMAE